MMKDKNTYLPSPQLVNEGGTTVALAHKQIVSLYKKSEQSGIPFDTLKEVYQRGFAVGASEQSAFNRVNSFVAGGAAMKMDEDLLEKRGLWDNIHAKRERIKHGSGEHMRKPGSKGAPSAKDLRDSQTKNESVNGEKVSQNHDDPANRFAGTDELIDNYRSTTPGQTVRVIKKVVREQLEEDSKGYKSEGGGLTQKGRDHYNNTTGSHLKAPVTKKPSKLKPGSKSANRRKSFCARMGGMKKRLTSAKTAHDPDSRINKALRKWNC